MSAPTLPRPSQKPGQTSSQKPRASRRATRVDPTTSRPRGSRPALTVAPRHVEGVRLLSTATLMLGLVCLFVLVQMVGLSTFSQNRAQDLLHHEFRGQLAAATAPVSSGTEPGAPVALLRIPAIGLEQTVVEGTAAGDLQAGPGHLRSSVLPGQAGVSVVMGKAATYGHPFGDLGSLHPGDTLETVTGQGITKYVVSGVRRAGDPLPAALPDGASRLTLVTAEGTGPLALLRPGNALFVDAQSATSFPAMALPDQVPAGERVMASETSALPLLVLHLAVLLGGVVLVVLARSRWSGLKVWLVASPLVLALAWSTTDVVTRLLPNLT